MDANKLRELFDFAAKAIGLDAYSRGPMGDHENWNPADSNDDSRSLQVALGITVTPYPIYSSPKHSVIAKQHRNSDTMRVPNPTEVVELYGNNAEAATRLAVLRCAAAIGREMP